VAALHSIRRPLIDTREDIEGFWIKAIDGMFGKLIDFPLPSAPFTDKVIELFERSRRVGLKER
jgi:hypothetical protein